MWVQYCFKKCAYVCLGMYCLNDYSAKLIIYLNAFVRTLLIPNRIKIDSDPTYFSNIYLILIYTVFKIYV